MKRLFTRPFPANQWQQQFKEPPPSCKQEVHNCRCHCISQWSFADLLPTTAKSVFKSVCAMGGENGAL